MTWSGDMWFLQGLSLLPVLVPVVLSATAQPDPTTSAHDFTVAMLDGQEVSLAQFRGQPILLVNTASRCGYTPQYSALQTLWERYRDRGLVVLGVPSNDFGQQEPGTAAQIAQFCTLNYGVDFPLTAKVHVVGPEAHPLYRWLATALGARGVPQWNFYKYLIAPDGHITGAWPSQVKPLAPELTQTIDQVLAPQ